MGSYGPNFEFRIVPAKENRLARFATQLEADYSTVIPMGAPVKAVGEDGLDRQYVELADTATPPIKGRVGVAIYEHSDGATWAGVDPMLTTYSDLSVLPFGRAVQVISGPNVKVVFRNTVQTPFLGSTGRAGRNMVAEAGGSPSVVVGSYLEPHTSPSDANGYYQVTTTLANAWFVVVGIDSVREEVEAQFLF
jgi:hypothetical protein